MNSTIRRRVLAGEPVVGTFCAIPHPAAVEMLAACGFDFLCLDGEHAAMNRETIESLVRAADAGGVPALVRVAGNSPESLGAALDSGAAGVVVPRVNTADEAGDVVRGTRYPPLGERGAGPGRASGYGRRLGSYLATANSELLVAVQVETALAVANASDIAAVAGIDLVFIGPGDLGVSLGVSPEHSELTRAVTTVVDTCRDADRAVGIFRPTTDDVAAWRSAGVSLFVLAADSVFVTEAATAAERAARAALGRCS